MPPTPQNFELWFNHLGVTNPELSQRMYALLQNSPTPTAEALEVIYLECFGRPNETEIEAFEDGAEAIEQVAHDAVTHLADGQRYLQDYDQVLSTVRVELVREQTVDRLVKTVAVLVAETSRASGLNRSLQTRLAASAAQVRKLRLSLADVKKDATTDALTGLINRRGFDDRLRRSMARARTDKQPICLLIADVDRFKTFNDTYGHRSGDLVLRLVARLLDENVKGKDIAARFGGEEFAIILIGTDEYAGGRVAERIRAALDGKHLMNRGNGQHLRGVTISIGVAELRTDERAASWIERADAALYQAKNTGETRFV